jgi:nickel/cobalt exporter
MTARLQLIGTAAAAAWLCCAVPAAAHRLDEYLQASRFSVHRNHVNVEIDLTAGVSVAPQVSASIDTDHDGRISEDEGREYAAQVLRSIELYVDKKPVTLMLTSDSFPDLGEMAAGTGIIRLRGTAKYAPLAAGSHDLFFRNMHEPKISVYLANALVPEDRQIEITGQQRDTGQRELTIDYRVLPEAKSSWMAWLGVLLGISALALPLNRFVKK